ncbi:hypothetical protein WHR41_08183 [Cladosporium halotolerans]|uniref:MYND-type domain-containing protein n=1 Tax=Cladosporium halotolerans TaxID=1052096 RepID=A0AB34KHY7_9PEZI
MSTNEPDPKKPPTNKPSKPNHNPSNPPTSPPPDVRLPFNVQIGQVTTVGALLANPAPPFQAQRTIHNPKPSELHASLRASLEALDEQGDQEPNNGFPPGTCAGCGKAEGLRVCGGCGGRKYCGRECQRRDWRGHKGSCCGKVGGEGGKLV